MKDRMLNVLKCFLMALGILFLIQMILFLGALIGISSFHKMDFGKVKFNQKNIKPMKALINYVENYKLENKKYPKNIDTSKIKIKPDFYFEYKTSKDDNCYTIILKNKKDNNIKEYNHCSIEQTGLSSHSDSYIEYNE